MTPISSRRGPRMKPPPGPKSPPTVPPKTPQKAQKKRSGVVHSIEASQTYSQLLPFSSPCSPCRVSSLSTQKHLARQGTVIRRGKTLNSLQHFNAGRERRGGRERDGGREATDVDTTRAPTGLNLSPCQQLG